MLPTAVVFAARGRLKKRVAVPLRQPLCVHRWEHLCIYLYQSRSYVETLPNNSERNTVKWRKRFD